jgi:amino acid adenylation domain-containing protein
LIEGRARQVVLICDDDTGEAEFDARAALPLTRLRASDGEILDPVPARPELQLFQPKPESPAYISFTSGSTGTPKAILCNHNGLSHFITWEREEFHVTPADRVAQLSRLSFDVAMRDIFLPLTSGAVLCVPPDQTQFDTDQVLEWLEAEAVSIIHIVPAVAQASLTRLSPDVTLKHLRWTLFAGEALPAHLVQRWREAFPLAGEIANLYGPTETTLAKFYYHVPRAVCPGTQPVGRPLPHTQGLVVNRSAQLCGIGEPGEIVIRTPYRSLGYINASREQSDRFVVNHYRNDADDILYYTGDRGRYRADGQLEIQGRMDHQVKIGGVRIELGEVESVLGKHPDVSECVAAVKGDSPDNQRLVAYVVPKPGATPSISSLRELIKRELPKYQHPSHFIILEKLELLPNGKVDRNLLPDPGTARPATEDAYVAPRDEVELKLSHIWEDVLKISPVGVTDNFFDLGGHSLLAVRLMAQIHKAFDVWLPLSSLFDEATVEMLALRLRRPHTGSHDPLVAIQPQGHRLPLFFVHAAGGNVLCYSDLAKHLGPDQPFYGLQSFGFEEGTEPLNRIEDMAACYVAAIVKAQAEGPYLLGGWSMGGIVAYEMAQQLVRNGQQVALLALLDHSPPEPGDIDEGLDEISLMQRFFDGRVEIDPESLEAMSVDQRLAYFLQQATSLKLVPPDLGISQIKSYLKVYRANVRALRSYSAEPYAGRITLLRTKYEIAGADDTLGWGALAAQGVDVFEVPGKHSDMMTEPHLNILAQYLKACLDKVQSAR